MARISNQLHPSDDCALCPRLKDFRLANRKKHPSWHNKPVAPFGAKRAPLAIVGLAPGLGGANRTGRPFTGDGAGELLFPTLLELNLATGEYHPDGKDTLTLRGCRIFNVLRCVPPQNIATREEIFNCRKFFQADLKASNASVFLALGMVAHRAVLDLFELRPYTRFPFKHGAVYELEQGERRKTKTLVSSYHCSRRNTSSGILTRETFIDVIARAKRLVEL